MLDAKFALHDRVLMRKKHACGKNEWEILRTGADIKIKCLNCGHVIMMDRIKFLSAAKKILPATAGTAEHID